MSLFLRHLYVSDVNSLVRTILLIFNWLTNWRRPIVSKYNLFRSNHYVSVSYRDILRDLFSSYKGRTGCSYNNNIKLTFCYLLFTFVNCQFFNLFFKYLIYSFLLYFYCFFSLLNLFFFLNHLFKHYSLIKRYLITIKLTLYDDEHFLSS